MKFSIHKTALIGALGSVAGSAKAMSSLPILTAVLIETQSDTITLRTCNAEMEMTVSAEASVAKAGSCAIPHAALLRIANLADGDDITINADRSKAAITAGRFKSSLPIFDAGEFPPVAVIFGAGEVDLIKVNSAAFLAGLKAVKWSMCKQGERPPLDGVNIEVQGGKITLIATNGYCASVVNLGDTTNADANVTIPFNTVNELAKARKDDGDTSICLDARRAKFTMPDSMILNSAVHAKRFPQWRQVIPQSQGQAVKVNRERLILAGQRVLVASVDDEKAAVMRFDPNQVSLSLAVNGREANDQFEAECPLSDTFIALNVDYLLAALRSVTDEAVTIVYRDELSPLEIKTANGLFLIMPVRKI